MERDVVIAVSVLASSVILYPIVRWILNKFSFFSNHKVGVMIFSIFITLSILVLFSPHRFVTLASFWQVLITFAIVENKNEYLRSDLPK